MPERSDYKTGRSGGGYNGGGNGNGGGFGGNAYGAGGGGPLGAYVRETSISKPSSEPSAAGSSERKNKHPQAQRKCDLARRERRKIAGMCITCGKSEAAEGMTRCLSCRTMHNSATTKTRAKWIEQGICRDCGKYPMFEGYKRCQSCMEARRVNARRHNKDIRSQVLEHYGSKCACCGEQQVLFLDVDHIDNDGAQHRRSISREGFSGTTFYRWLVRNHYPDGFQLLCRNCNWGKHRNGGTCPHKEVKDGRE